FHIEIEAPQRDAGLFDFGVKEVTMIGMSFISFMELLGISVVVALVLHYLVKYRNIAGFEGFLGKVIIGWVGALLGSPVFCLWPANLSFDPSIFGLSHFSLQRCSVFQDAIP